MLDRISTHLLGHRRLHLALLALLTILFAVAIEGVRVGDRVLLPGLRVDNSLEVWFRSDDPNWVTYEAFQDQFERDELVLLAFETEDLFTTAALDKIEDLTRKLESLPHVERVVSLTNVEHFRGEDGVLTVSELVPSVPSAPEALARLRRVALDNPLYVDNLVSRDGRTTAILVRLEKAADGVNVQRRVTDEIYALLERETEGGRYAFHAAGVPILLGLEDRASTDDATLEYGLSLLLVVAVLYLMHRRWTYVWISLVVVAISNVWIHGLMALCGSTYNMITTILATLVLVIGIADSVHFIAEYRAQAGRTRDGAEAVRRAFRHIAMPCLFTSLTTAVGFASMVTSSLGAVQAFGLYAAVAILMTFLVNMSLGTVWLSYLKVPTAAPGVGSEAGLMRGYLGRVAAINRRHVKINVVVALAVFLVSFTGIVRIQVNTNEILYFREDHPIRVATDFIERNLTGTIPLEIMLTGEPDAFLEPEVLRRVEALERFLSGREHLRKTFSPVPYVKEINRVVHDGDPAAYRVPDRRDLVAQLMLLAEGSDTEDLESYLDLSDYARARIQCRLDYVGTNEMRAVQREIQDEIGRTLPPVGIRAEMTGGVPLYLNMVDYLLESQIRGFSLALVVIFLMLSLLVRSLKLGLLAMVPNCVPVFLTFGIMGWAGIHLDLGTVLIASIAIGLAVDDTIHFLARFRTAFEARGTYEAAIEETIHTIGVPITVTSVVLFLGFGVFMVSTFKPIVYFGLLSAVTMLSALLADLFVLPALIKLLRPLGPERPR